GVAEAKLVHHGHRARTHGDDVTHDAADPGGGTLERFDERRMIVALHLEGHRPALTDIDDTRILTDSDHEAFAHPVVDFLAELAQVHFGALVGAVLTPHDGVHGEFTARGATTQNLADQQV